jgi:hypothetical protein
MVIIEETYIIEFENIFGLSFKNIVNILDMDNCILTCDDGIEHFIDVIKKDVYSFDTEDEIWLEKNLYQSDILYRINDN